MAFPTGWAWKAPITIPAAKISGNNANFPVLLTAVNFPATMMNGGVNSALNGGGDVRFSEDAAGAVQLPCEIVSFVTGGTPSATVWAKRPTLNSGADRTIYVWYKKAGEVQPVVTDPFGRNAVWVDYQVVSHDGAIDSTGNTVPTQFGAPTTAPGPFGTTNGAVSLDGLTQFVRSGVSVPFVSPITLQAWSRPTSFNTSGPMLVSLNDSAVGDQHILLRLGHGGSWPTNQVYAWGRFANALNSANAPLSPKILTLGSWLKTTMSWRASSGLDIFVDGANKATGTGPFSSANTADRFTWGRADDSTPGQYFTGDLAEIRLRLSTLLDSWITTEYNNQSSPATFALPGTPVAVGGGVTLSPNNAASSHTAGNVTLSQAQSLTVQGADHSQAASNVTLAQGSTLAVNNAAHAVVSNTGAIAQAQTLNPANATQTQAADNVALSQFQSLVAGNATHGLGSDSPAQAQQSTLTIANGLHSLTSDAATLAQIQALSVQNATHGLTGGNVTFNPVAVQPGADRTLTLQSESRTSLPTGGDRTTRPANNRTLRI